MSSYNGYTAPPQSPTFGFFPNAPSAPHAFSAFHADPRDTHAMYASLGSHMGNQPGSQSSPTGGSQNPLRRLYRK
ncbi:hypothetical protein SCLCIDRAFT_1207389 [Scleroderma citrinum Foug A]|uniref:Uncharacterized protein n=1 Tax=Scleroderma citrinum Foug A TaxID=1036808 RepID=A0A0C3EPN5_9AGAM|nr:hypothetical protein SCLCIDRAFT_1207389 [Scleroderma citrinum Foug A]